MNLVESTHLGIPGVYLMDSGIPGPTVAISACTHGGEHAGLKAINHLVDVVDIKKYLVKGKIYFILTNIEAYKKSVANNNDSPATYRFHEANLNRCCTVEAMTEGSSYEARRAKELESILRGVDYHLDIHSAYGKAPAIAITTEKSRELVLRVLNVDRIYENLTQVQIGRPFIDIVERHGGIGIGLEAGYEKDNTGFQIGVENSLRLLSGTGLIDAKLLEEAAYPIKKNKLIYTYGSIVPTQRDFTANKDFGNEEIAEAGTIIGKDANMEYKVDRKSHILLPSNPEKIRKTIVDGMPEEFCFLGEVE